MPQQRIAVRTHGALRQEFAFEAGNEAHLLSQQDCTAIAEANKEASKNFKGTTKNGTAIAARVPAIYRYVKWPAEFERYYGAHPDHPPAHMKMDARMEMQAAWAKFYRGKLNHPNFRHFRTDGGRRL